MDFYFDDSGDFSIPQTNAPKISLWMGIAIPEICWERLRKNFSNWEKNLPESLKKGEEIKGHILDRADREHFFDIIDDESDLLFQPGIIDLQSQKAHTPSNLPEIMKEEQILASTQIKDDETEAKALLQAKRIGNLSVQQVLKFFCLSNCIMETVRHAILFRSAGRSRKCWEKVNIWIDRSGKNTDSREDLILKESLPYIIHNLSRRRPFNLIKEIHTKDHPFIKIYRTDRGINTSKLFENIFHEKSSSQWGIRFADIIANTFYSAINDIDNTEGMLQYYSRIMKYSPLEPGSDLGFMLIAGAKEENKPIQLSRYAHLQEIVASMR